MEVLVSSLKNSRSLQLPDSRLSNLNMSSAGCRAIIKQQELVACEGCEDVKDVKM